MLPRLLLLALLSTAAALLAPAAAPAKVSVGIADNNVAIFGDPAFKSLGAKRVRVVLSWNAMSRGVKGDNEITERIAPYLDNAGLQGIEVLAAVQHHRGDPVNCSRRSGRRKPQCKLPTVRAYKREMRKLVKRFPSIKYLTAWNEANHNTQPTYRNARRAGQFARAADQVCRAARTCRVVAMDILDSADNPTATRGLRYRRTSRYIRALRRAYGKTPAICGIHNYADVNRFRTSGTKALTRAMRCRQHWLTETGGFYRFASFWRAKTRKLARGKGVGRCVSAATCQVAALRFLFKRTVKAAKRINRVYVYNFYSGDDGRFDAGLTKGSGNLNTRGRKRPAYKVVKQRIR